MDIFERNGTSRALFIGGCLLAVVGLACSETQQPLWNVAGALANVLAIMCGVGMIYLQRVHRSASVLPRSQVFLWTISIVLIMTVAANLYSFRYPAWHGYIQPLMMFVLAVQILVNVASFRDSSAV